MNIDISDFTDRQKMFFFKIQVAALIKILKKKNSKIMELMESNEELALSNKDLYNALETKNRKIKFQKKQLKFLRS